MNILYIYTGTYISMYVHMYACNLCLTLFNADCHLQHQVWTLWSRMYTQCGLPNLLAAPVSPFAQTHSSWGLIAPQTLHIPLCLCALAEAYPEPPLSPGTVAIWRVPTHPPWLSASISPGTLPWRPAANRILTPTSAVYAPPSHNWYSFSKFPILKT